MLLNSVTFPLHEIQPHTAIVSVSASELPVVSTVQERLTKQIAVAITEALQPTGVGVVIEAT